MSVSLHTSASGDEGRIVPLRVFEKQEDGIDSVVWHPDGQRIISGSSAGELRIWDAEMGLQLGETIKGHTAAVYALDVSRDGTMFASGSWDRTLKLWHCDTGESVHTWEDHHEDRIYDVHFSPNSKMLASASGDYTVRVWDVGSGELVFEPIKCKGYVWAVRYSPNGERIASGGDGIQIRDLLHNGVELVLTIEQSVNSLAWTHDGEQLIAGELGNVTIWNATSGEEIRTWEAHRRWIDLSLSPITTHLVTCDGYGYQSSVIVFDIETKEQVSTYEHDGTVADVAYSPSGKYLATACAEAVYLWNAPSPRSSSPGSSILDLPAVIQPRETRGHDPVMDLLSNTRGSFLDLSAASRSLGTTTQTRPETRTKPQERRTFRGLRETFRRPQAKRTAEQSGHQQHTNVPGQSTVLSQRTFSSAFTSVRNSFVGVLRRRTPSSRGNHEERMPEGDWVAESRTRPIYAFETGPLPDEIERGWLFHLASYICYCQRDPNVNVPRTNVSNSASRQSPLSTSTTADNVRSDPRVASSTSRTARARAALEDLSASLRSCMRPGTSVCPPMEPSAAAANCPDSVTDATIHPTLVVTSPSLGSIRDVRGPMAAQESLASTTSGPSSAAVSASPGPSHHVYESPGSSMIAPRPLNVNITHRSEESSTLQLPSDIPWTSHDDGSVSGTLSSDEVAILQEYRRQKEKFKGTAEPSFHVPSLM